MPGTVSKLYSAELDGINAELIEVEADINVGLHSFNVVGLGDKAVSEAKERVNSALKNSGIKPPTKENRRITINLAPADIKKTGSHLDLPIAIAYLLASEQIRHFKTSDKLFIGELSLDGSVRRVSGVLNIALLAEKKHIHELFVPKENAEEAAAIHSLAVFPVASITELILHLEGTTLIPQQQPTELFPSASPLGTLLSDVKGNEFAKRALLIAAAGGHNVLLSGPPGTGKTMLAEAFASILPPPTRDEIIEMTQIYSSLGEMKNHSFISWRPFRSPHHSSSLIALMGGGSNPRPGEISLAHRGVLFLDEMPEFHRDVLEGLRQPLENGEIHISRAKRALVFPARFILIGAMNPCPCGHFEDPGRECTCTAYEILKYQRKISGPLLDRFDIQLEIPRVPIEKLKQKTDATENKHYAETIIRARETQKKRFSKTPRIKTNADMTSKMTDYLVTLDTAAELFLKQVLEKHFVSPRGYYRILKIARTIADIEEKQIISAENVAEAFHYRVKTNE